jgi:hypothetical protein
MGRSSSPKAGPFPQGQTLQEMTELLTVISFFLCEEMLVIQQQKESSLNE